MAAELPSLGLLRVLQDRGLEFATFLCLTIASGMKLNHVGRRRSGSRQSYKGSCLTAVTMAELRAKCLFHPLGSQFRKVTYCWPPLSPAITFDSNFARHHEAKKKARGVKQASVYSSVFCSCFLFFSSHCAPS